MASKLIQLRYIISTVGLRFKFSSVIKVDLCSWIPVNEAETKIMRSDAAAAHHALLVCLMQD